MESLSMSEIQIITAGDWVSDALLVGLSALTVAAVVVAFAQPETAPFLGYAVANTWSKIGTGLIGAGAVATGAGAIADMAHH